MNEEDAPFRRRMGCGVFRQQQSEGWGCLLGGALQSCVASSQKDIGACEHARAPIEAHSLDSACTVRGTPLGALPDSGETVAGTPPDNPRKDRRTRKEN